MPLDGGVKCQRREPFRVVRRKRVKKEMIEWEKVKVEVRERVEVKVKGVSQVQRADPQERGAITLLLRRASDSWDLYRFFQATARSRGGGVCLAPGRGSKVPRREPFRVVRRKRAKKEMIKWEKVKVEVKGKEAIQAKTQANLQEKAVTISLRRTSNIRARISTNDIHELIHLILFT